MRKIWKKINEKHFIPNKILLIVLILTLIASSLLIYKTIIGVQPATLDLKRTNQ